MAPSVTCVGVWCLLVGMLIGLQFERHVWSPVFDTRSCSPCDEQDDVLLSRSSFASVASILGTNEDLLYDREGSDTLLSDLQSPHHSIPIYEEKEEEEEDGTTMAVRKSRQQAQQQRRIRNKRRIAHPASATASNSTNANTIATVKLFPDAHLASLREVFSASTLPESFVAAAAAESQAAIAALVKENAEFNNMVEESEDEDGTKKNESNRATVTSAAEVAVLLDA